MNSISTVNPMHGNVYQDSTEDSVTYKIQTRVISNRVIYLMFTELIFCITSFYFATHTPVDFSISGNFYVSKYFIMDGLVRMFVTIFAIYLTYQTYQSTEDLAMDCVSWCALALWTIWEIINYFVTIAAINVCQNCVDYLYVLLIHSIVFGICMIAYIYKKRLCCFKFVKLQNQDIQIEGKTSSTNVVKSDGFDEFDDF